MRPVGQYYLGNTDCHYTAEFGTANYGSQACLLYQTEYLVESNFTQDTMTAAAYLVAEGDHINHGLWAWSGIPCNSWVEEDYVYGFQYHNYYEYALARSNYNYPPNPYEAYSDGVTSTGVPVKFQIKYIGNQTWQVWRGESLRWTFSGGTLGAGACIAQAGLEVSRRPGINGIDAGYTSYTHNQDLYWYDSSMTFQGGWGSRGTAYSSITYPCNLGQVPPNCLNGTFNTGIQWADNKP